MDKISRQNRLNEHILLPIVIGLMFVALLVVFQQLHTYQLTEYHQQTKIHDNFSFLRPDLKKNVGSAQLSYWKDWLTFGTLFLGFFSIFHKRKITYLVSVMLGVLMIVLLFLP